MNPLAKFAVCRYTLLRIEAIQTAKFVRRVGAISGGDVIYPTADMGQPLRFRQIGLTSPQVLFCLLLVLDVVERPIPLDDVSVLIRERHASGEKPLICPARSTDSDFVLVWQPGRHRRAPRFLYSRKVIGMNQHPPTPVLSLRQRHTVELQPTLVEKVDRAIGLSSPDVGGNCVDNEQEAILGLLEFGKSLFQSRSRLVLLGDVHHRPNKLEFARLISFGMSHNMDMFD